MENAPDEVLQVSELYPVPQALMYATPFTGVRSEAVTPTASEPGAPNSSLSNWLNSEIQKCGKLAKWFEAFDQRNNKNLISLTICMIR